jgi:hypothetical protein
MKNRPAKVVLALVLLAAAASPLLLAADGTPAIPVAASLGGRHCPHCGQCQEEICYQNVVTHRCVLVPDVKQIKKTVYECKEVPFCLHKLPKLFSHHKHDCCEDCPECECPRYKKVLLKKEIVCEEICGTKCVIEEVVERVPCRVCKPCPHCSQAVPGCAQPAPAPIVTRSLSDETTMAATPLIPPPPVPQAE